MKIIEIIKDVDYMVMRDFDLTDENVKIRFDQKHGDVLYVSGLCEDDEDALTSLGTEDWKNYTTAFYTPLLDYSLSYYSLIGRDDLAAEVYRIKTECR